MENSRKKDKWIHLDELPSDGFDFTFTQESGELNEDLFDLLAGRPYRLELRINPAGNAYEVRGSLSTTLPLLCSRCAVDIDYKIEERFHEILVIQPPLDRKSKTSHTNHLSDISDKGPFCNYLDSEEFNVGSWAHEILALAEPANPLGKPNCDDSCENFQMAIKNGWIQEEEKQAASPFSVLANLKVPPNQ